MHKTTEKRTLGYVYALSQGKVKTSAVEGSTGALVLIATAFNSRAP